MKMPFDDDHCPLCGGKKTELFFEDARRRYLACDDCGLVFVPRRFWLSSQEERAIYDLHQNDVRDQGYRQFLSRLSGPLLERLGAKQKGLDFGCGPGPALAHLLKAGGHQVDLYDPLYHNDTAVFQRRYDFICATEVVEHLHQPGHTFGEMFKMLKKGGWLAVMTKLVIDADAFRQWHYIRDMTHVCFYGRGTFDHIARQYNAEVHFIEKDVVFLHKK